MIQEHDTAKMVPQIKRYRSLNGFRCQPATDIKVMEEILLRISCLVENVSNIVELNLNLIFALPEGQGCRTVETRIRVEPNQPRPVVWGELHLRDLPLSCPK